MPLSETCDCTIDSISDVCIESKGFGPVNPQDDHDSSHYFSHFLASSITNKKFLDALLVAQNIVGNTVEQNGKDDDDEDLDYSQLVVAFRQSSITAFQ
jgi:hypothetical protein